MTRLKGFTGLAAALAANEAAKGSLCPSAGDTGKLSGLPGNIPAKPKRSGYAGNIALPADEVSGNDPEGLALIAETRIDNFIDNLLEAQSQYLAGTYRVHGPSPQKMQWVAPKLKQHQLDKLGWAVGHDRYEHGVQERQMSERMARSRQRHDERQAFIEAMSAMPGDVIYCHPPAYDQALPDTWSA